MPRSVLYDRANERSGGSEVTKTEKHIVGEHESGWIFTSEVPLEEGPSSVVVTGSTGAWTEVTDGTPATKEYDVAYDIATPESRAGAIKFNSSDDGEAVTIQYEGRGTKPFAGMFNDLQDSVGQWNINMRKAVADTPDEEFNSSTHFAGLWTVVDGSTGTINLIGSTGGVYHLYPDRSVLVMQLSNGNNVKLRQQFTLPTGKSMIAKVALGGHAKGTNVVNNELQAIFGFGGSTAAVDGGSAGTYSALYLDTDTTNKYEVLGFNGTVSTIDTDRFWMVGQPVYLRIARSSSKYYHSYSLDGMSWAPGDAFHAISSTSLYLWIEGRSAAAAGTPSPTVTWYWVRQGDNDYFPW
jgi:hypothetical protein